MSVSPISAIASACSSIRRWIGHTPNAGSEKSLSRRTTAVQSTHELIEPKGDPGNTLTREELEDKAIRLAEYTAGATPGEMRRIFDLIYRTRRISECRNASPMTSAPARTYLFIPGTPKSALERCEKGCFSFSKKLQVSRPHVLQQGDRQSVPPVPPCRGLLAALGLARRHAKALGLFGCAVRYVAPSTG